MKTRSNLRLIICYAAIAILMLFNNLLLPKLNKVSFSFDDFSSEFLNIGDHKEANGGDPGYLAFGPYIDCGSGSFSVSVSYSADSDGNSVDVYSASLGEKFAEAGLSPGSSYVVVSGELPADVTDLEIRVFYCGNGSLSLNKAAISERITDMYIIIGIYDVVLLAAAVCITIYIIKAKGIKKEVADETDKGTV